MASTNILDLNRAFSHPKFLHILAIVGIISNGLLFSLHLIYLIYGPILYLAEIHGVLIFGVFLFNLFIAYVIGRLVNKKTSLGYRVNMLSIYYLAISGLAMFMNLFGNFVISATNPGVEWEMTLSIITIVTSIISIPAFGLFLCVMAIQYKRQEDDGGYTRKKHVLSGWQVKVIRYSRRLLIFLSTLILLGGGFFFNLVLFFPSLHENLQWVGVFVPQFAAFFFFIFMGDTVILLRLERREKTPKIFFTTMIIGFIISGTCLVPIVTTNTTIAAADNEFANAFGNDWKDRIPSEVTDSFLKTQFYLSSYFINNARFDYVLSEDILFYTGTTGNDVGITLFFDAYLPARDASSLPGNYSTLVRIHGGGWQIGDKGRGNMVSMNKYFAHMGYVVFDVQYGLRSGGWDLPIITPEHVLGDNITTDDMVRHLGLFFQYITAQQSTFGCNLNSTFISGGSAGGHLTCAAGLAIVSGNYTSLFGNNITVKGLIPFYPGNGLAFGELRGSNDEFWDPTLLVNSSSPPCLIFQGTHDFPEIVDASYRFKNAYTSYERPCALLIFPFAGHGNDIHFSGHYNQVFLYYMERFMYLYH